MTFEEAIQIIHSLGYASKMPCWTYSVSAKKCKRGRKLRKIKGSVCNKCYAARGNFIRPTIQAGLDKRMESMLHPQWSEAMGVVLTMKEHSGFFRWYSSGDLQSISDLHKICDVCIRTPHITHWLPTHEVGILGEFKRLGFKYPNNLVVRLSADMIEANPNTQVMTKLGVLGSAVSKANFTCPSYKTDNMCGTCRFCWDKTIPIVTYKYH
jgi:hypothetical protein